MKFDLAAGLALVCIALIAGVVYFAGQADKHKARADTLAVELDLRQQIDLAAAGARIIVNAPRADMDRAFREFLQEAASDPLPEECSRHPAFNRAYSAIDRLQRIQSDALRGNSGRPDRAQTYSGEVGKAGR